MNNQSPRYRHSLRLKGYDYRREGMYFVTVCVQDRECLFGQIEQGQMQLNAAGQLIQTIWQDIPRYYDGVEIDQFIVMPNHIHAIVCLVGAGPRACPMFEQIDFTETHTGQPQRVAPTICHNTETEAVGAGPRACPMFEQIDFTETQTGQPQRVAPTICHNTETEAVGAGPRACPVFERINFTETHTGQPQGVAPTLSLSDVMHHFKSFTTRRYIEGVKTLNWPSFRCRLWQRNYYEHIIRSEASLASIRAYIQNNPAQWAQDEENPLNKVVV